MSKSFKINKPGVRKLTRELQREFDRNPVSVSVQAPVNVSEQIRQRGSSEAPAVINNYNAPVVTNYGSHAQIAWDAENITQHSEYQENVAAGFEEFAQCLAQILADVNKSAIDEEEKQKFRTAAEQTLQETAQPEPDVSVLSAGADRLKGILAAVAIGLQQGITAEAQEAARQGIEAIAQLPGFLP